MGTDRRILICVAAPRERDAVFDAVGVPQDALPGTITPLTEGVDSLVTGVGPTAAAVSAAVALARGGYGAVANLGIGGAYQGSGLKLGETVLSTRSVLAGEGRAEAERFVGLAAMGFGAFAGEDWRDTSRDLVGRLTPLADQLGPIATVSAASGSDELAARLAARTGAVAEAMEGAAIHLACERFGVPFAELRVISNVVGDRERHPWRLDEALERLGGLAAETVAALTG